jgi:acyl-CoA reductase-like NAD-dependent aldehyde dehydrogenase
MSAIPKIVDAPSPEYLLLINGELKPGAASLDVINPATGKLLTRCARADKAQLEAAIAAAKVAFPAWSSTTIQSRRQALLKVADALESRVTEFAKLLTQEQGKPLVNATGEIARAVAMIRAFAAMDLPDTVLRDNER